MRPAQHFWQNLSNTSIIYTKIYNYITIEVYLKTYNMSESIIINIVSVHVVVTKFMNASFGIHCVIPPGTTREQRVN